MKFVSTGSPAASRPRACNNARWSDEAGFSLLETLVGMTIFAVALTALLGAYANASRAAKASAQHAAAQQLAQSLLARATAVRHRALRSSKGRTNGYRWQIRVRPANARTGGLSHPEWRLYRVGVKVSWGRGRHVELATLKLARPAR